MGKERPFASRKEVEAELQNLDIVLLLKKLEEYAAYLLYDQNRDKALDIASDVFEKLISQERKWYSGTTLESTLFFAAKSLCNNENKKLYKRREVEVEGIDIEKVSSSKQRDQFDTLNFNELKAKAFEILKKHDPPPDYLEELIFECWIEGLTKQQKISAYLEKDIVEIRKGVKRLKRKLGPVKDEFVKMGYEQE